MKTSFQRDCYVSVLYLVFTRPFALRAPRAMLFQVIKRLITKDGLLIYHGEPDDGAPDEEKRIAVHPNYATG